MRIVQLTDEADFAVLTRKLFGPRVGDKRIDAAMEAIKAANPGVDLDHPSPGTLLFVPDLERAAPVADPDVSTGLVSSISAVFDGWMTELTELADAQLAENARHNRSVAAALDDPAAVDAAAGNEQLEDLLRQLGEELKAQPGRDADQVQDVATMVQHWTEQTRFLRAAGGG